MTIAYDPIAEAEAIIRERRFKNISLEWVTAEASKDVADELTRIRCEMTAIRLLLTRMVEPKDSST